MSRSYLVLRKRDDDDAWAYADTLEAGGAEQAIRAAAADGGAGVYAAVPARNWTRVNVTVEPVPARLKLEAEPTR